MSKRILYVIPARGGSKGVPGKNIKPLADKPLIQYSIEVARSLAADEDICVSTDDEKIRTVVEKLGVYMPFLRPAALSTDQSGTYEVLLHALDFYAQQGKEYDLLVLLQPTSPFRKAWQVKEAIAAWKPGLEMVVSVMHTKANPYYILFEENADGFLAKCKPATFKTRQECPPVYQFNGAIYVIDIPSLLQRPINAFDRVIKYIMDEESSVDIDTPLDWKFAEFLIQQQQSGI